MECVAVDWSGALTGASSRIWIARAVGGALTALEAPGSRAAVERALLERRSDATPCLVGLDFAFSLPAWFAASRGWQTVDEVWRAAHDDGERWLRDCEPPFWGRPGIRRAHEPARGLRETERAWASTQQPKSVFQVGGAGSVGTGSLRGMPMLRVLRSAGWAVWPFDAPDRHTLVEIYPRRFTGPVVKSQRTARADWIARSSLAVPERFAAVMIGSEDAFDAGISAIMMSRALDAGAVWPVVSEQAEIEGQIWEPIAPR
ncbi:MAG: hypothetical protein U5K74_07600 [Gemmatimonadaceae bacterium]|nr:hypothetical protein [Gemmatimonadaceae bacterium]